MKPQQDDGINLVYWELAGFIEQELSAMTDNIVSNYADNVRKRANNPFLRFNNSSINKYMALGRSLDSQLGNRLQRIILHIARVKYGLLRVPNVVSIDVANEAERNIVCKLYSVPFVVPASMRNNGFNPYQQAIYIGCNKSDRDIKRILKIKARADVLQTASFSFNRISEEALQHIKSKSGRRILVDLLFFDCPNDTLNNANAFEIKMGGNLDTKNARSNADEVKELSNIFGFLPANFAYFATCYGTCSESVADKVTEVMGENALLNGRQFWDKVIPSTPETFDYEDFIRVYNRAFLLSNIEARLREL